MTKNLVRISVIPRITPAFEKADPVDPAIFATDTECFAKFALTADRSGRHERTQEPTRNTESHAGQWLDHG